jgi:hypothetical protein
MNEVPGGQADLDLQCLDWLYLHGYPGPEHLDILTARDDLAFSYRSAGRTGEATAIGERVAADVERSERAASPKWLIKSVQPIGLQTCRAIQA